ncbi:hypothetical protein [Undibacterium fentianense]|uniref:Uncharacterized protein n=1 Tax=Undibacterium fentianense TaxID=2828728 RepID=A0A941E2C2_9BURK|nr:hypothetical protein [Undibacterium fentianense]MBR7799706.1 hypothetical protein [Undibacterium fentianense]
MTITPDLLQVLMKEVEKDDPIDFADLPFKEDELREIVALHLCEIAEKMINFSEEDKHLTLLAVAAKLVLENLVLHVQLMREHRIPLSREVDQLLQKLRASR